MRQKRHPEAATAASLLFPAISLFTRLTHFGNVIPLGLTQQQMKIIMELDMSGACRLSDLSRCAAVTHGTMTVAVQKLLKKGLLAKKKDPSDERALSLALTAAGKKTAVRIKRSTTELFNVICEELSPRDRRKFAQSYEFLVRAYKTVIQKKGIK